MVLSGDQPDAHARPLDYAGPTSAPRRRRLMPLVVKGSITAFLLLALLVAILLPSAGNARPQALRIACAANLRSLGQSIWMYSNAHAGAFPDTLERAVAGGFVPDVRVLLCPGSADTPAQGATPAAQAADLTAGGHLSYTYVGTGLTQAAHPDTVIAYDHAGNHEGGGGNVLFADGHVEWYNRAEFRTLVDRAAAGERPLLPRYLRAGTQPTTQPGP